jgi:hypothetical protein
MGFQAVLYAQGDYTLSIGAAFALTITAYDAQNDLLGTVAFSAPASGNYFLRAGPAPFFGISDNAVEITRVRLQPGLLALGTLQLSTGDAPVAPTPEPPTLLINVTGLALLGLFRSCKWYTNARSPVPTGTGLYPFRR